jgi:2-dehydropantoate 2-reductase
MKCLVFGAGAIGSLVGGLLFEAGTDISLIGRPVHVKAIEENGLKIEGAIQAVIKVPAYSDTNEIKDVDLIVITTKSYGTRMAMEKCKKLIQSHTRVLSLQNGIGNEDIISEHTPNVIGGITNNGVVFMENGRIAYNSPGTSTIGNYHSKNDEFVHKVREMFENAGLKCIVSSHIKDEIFKKFLVNVGINGLASIANVKNGEILRNEELRTIFLELVSEAIRVGKAKGFNCPSDVVNEIIKTVEATSENTNSMLQDLRKGKRTEVEYFNGNVVQYGKETGISTPYNMFVTNAVKFIEKKKLLSQS